MIVGLGRKALDSLEAQTLTPARAPALRPRDAASLVLIDPLPASGPHVLLGRRRADLAFMPNQFVFPGGRVDAADGTTALAGGLHAGDGARIAAGMGASATPRRVHALAVAALRECHEETGLIIGAAGSGGPAASAGPLGFAPDASGLRYVARAITPPGRIRRFDTRFFIAWRSAVTAQEPSGPPDPEFSELRWASIPDALELDCPEITKTILRAIGDRLAADPALTGDAPIPEFRMRHGRFVREWR